MPLVKAVPWSSKASWLRVYSLLHSQDNPEAKTLALNYMEAWKSRMRLPVAVECTLMLVSVLNTAASGEAQLGSALVRSLNFLVDQLQTGATAQSVELLASRLGIPKWVVDLRHDIVHGINFPHISVLVLACDLLLRKISDSYWHPQAALFQEDRAAGEISDLNEFYRVHKSGPTSKPAIHELKQLAPQISDHEAAAWLLDFANTNFQVACELSIMFMRIFSPAFPVHLINLVVHCPEKANSVELLMYVLQNFTRLTYFARHRFFAEARLRCHQFSYAERVMPVMTMEKSGDRKFLFVGLGKDLDWDTGVIHSYL